MILAIILLVLIVLLLAILIMFLFYMLFPSVKQQMEINDDPVLSVNEIKYRDKEIHEKNLVTDQRAFVFCSCNKKAFSTQDINFNEGFTCKMINDVYGTGTDCKYACIGLGDCAKVCPQAAISIVNRTARVSNLCIGCGKCVDVCPLGIIGLISKEHADSVLCKSASENSTNVIENVTCSEKNSEIKCVWNEQKYFKIWNYCYKIYQRIKY